jgi:hypothetical protein
VQMVAERGWIFDNISCRDPLDWYRYFWNGVLLALWACIANCTKTCLLLFHADTKCR